MDNASSTPQAPRRWSVWRVIWRIVVVVSVLFTGASAIRAGLTQCWDDKTDLSSPDGKYIARGWLHTCEGPTMFTETIQQVVDISRAGEDGQARVFESDEPGTQMRWEDNDHLRINIDGVANIGPSLHQALGVHIAYHVPRQLMSFTWWDTQEKQEEEMHRNGKLSDAEYESDKKENRRLRLWPARFIQWASENAIIDVEGK